MCIYTCVSESVYQSVRAFMHDCIDSWGELDPAHGMTTHTSKAPMNAYQQQDGAAAGLHSEMPVRATSANRQFRV